MNKEEIISSGLLEAYASGLCTAGEEILVQEWVAKDADVANELFEIEVSLQLYSEAHAIVPSPGLKEKISSQLFSNERSTVATDSSLNTPITGAKVVDGSSLWRKLAIAASLLLVGSAVTNFIFVNKYNSIQTAYVAQSKELSDKEAALATTRSEMDVVENKYSVPVSLKGLEAAPDAAAKIFWMKNTGEVYVSPANLPPAPAGMEYQLWGIVDGKPVDGGMIKTANGNKVGIQKMKSFGKAEAFAITLEKAGGNPQPEGKMYVMGTM